MAYIFFYNYLYVQIYVNIIHSFTTRTITGDRDEDHPQEEEMQKSKMAVWGSLTNSCEKKGSEKQRRKGKLYPFECGVPRIARRDKKAFFSDQCKEIEENNRMGKTRDLFRKLEIPREHFMQRWAR